MLTFNSKPEATQYLKGLGMKPNPEARGRGRQYWWYGDGTDALLDHSATVQKVGGVFYVSVFNRKG